MTDDNGARALAVLVEDLIKRIDTLTAATNKLTERTRRTERRSRWIAAFSAVTLLATAACGYALYQQYTTRLFVLCPLYSVIVGSYAPQTRPAEARAAYDQVFVSMRAAYDYLECPAAPVAPRLASPK